MAKLMKPLFIGGMFNKEGKRIRANYFKTIGNFKLWVGDGKPDRDYGKNADDKYYEKYTNEMVLADYENLKSGKKKLEDLSDRFWNGKKDMFLLGMVDECKFY